MEEDKDMAERILNKCMPAPINAEEKIKEILEG